MEPLKRDTGYSKALCTGDRWGRKGSRLGRGSEGGSHDSVGGWCRGKGGRVSMQDLIINSEAELRSRGSGEARMLSTGHGVVSEVVYSAQSQCERKTMP